MAEASSFEASLADVTATPELGATAPTDNLNGVEGGAIADDDAASADASLGATASTDDSSNIETPPVRNPISITGFTQ